MSDYDTAPPNPSNKYDCDRWTETRRRKRMIDGCWDIDLEERLLQHFGLTRRRAMGVKSRSKNPYRKLCDDLSVLYNSQPKVTHGASDEIPEFLGQEGLLYQSGLWQLAKKNQIYVVGLRECLFRAEWSKRTNSLTYRIVTPDCVTGRAYADDPANPVEISELRWREAVGAWCWDELSVADPANPYYRIVRQDKTSGGRIDVTLDVLGREYSGDAYPYRGADGVPYLPYVVYHAEWSSQLWNPYDWIEIVDASLDVACCATFFLHSVFRASWPQRWAMNAFVAGATPEDGDNGARRTEVVTDPDSLLHLVADREGTQPQIGQWAAGANVSELMQAISAYERSVMNVSGVDAANIVRDSADAWSGAALSISRDGKREAQKHFTPQFRASDLQLIEISAKLANKFGGFDFPETGYRIVYSAIPLDEKEQELKIQRHALLIEAGRMSIVEAYQEEHPGTTRGEALLSLQRIRAENAAVVAQDIMKEEPEDPAEPDDNTEEEPQP